MQIDLEQICCFWNKAKCSQCEITLKQDEVDNNGNDNDNNNHGLCASCMAGDTWSSLTGLGALGCLGSLQNFRAGFSDALALTVGSRPKW